MRGFSARLEKGKFCTIHETPINIGSCVLQISSAKCNP